jgi:N-acetylglucosaminyldiphosphoundecaprenol N-acetyl-beta-D-mannosaminyltransferase
MTRNELAQAIATMAHSGQSHRVYNVNINAMNIAAVDDDFAAWLNSADLVYCDGAGVRLGAAIHGLHLPERLGVMDWIDDALAALSCQESGIFLLGDEPGIAERCGEAMMLAHPGLRVVGTHHGFFSLGSAEERELIDRINLTKPNVLFVGMGMPRQERWIETNFGSLRANIFIPVGAAFRWYSRVQRQAPDWMKRSGLEWLYRLVRNPVRLFRRYVLGNPRFLLRVVGNRHGK